MAYRAVQFAIPTYSLFTFPRRNDLPTVLPIKNDLTTPFSLPSSIPSSFYYESLDARIPITFSCIYAATAAALNAFNKSRGYRPWKLSKTKTFFSLLVVHNILLAIYSAWTSVGMYRALKRTIQNPTGSAGLIGMMNSLCKIHGEGLWNEGLAFYGWFFYMSKFYEVVDTAIILAKGKKASVLQVYHHIGALLCMWAGIRYMSPPIWIPVLVNSGIHALMYTYYTLTAFEVTIPLSFKKSLTTIQIGQFFVSIIGCILFLFVRYTDPLEGLAFGARSSYRLDLGYSVGTTACISTSGEAFAIWLSILYLVPLTVLFVRFFIRSYLGRKKIEHGTLNGTNMFRREGYARLRRSITSK